MYSSSNFSSIDASQDLKEPKNDATKEKETVTRRNTSSSRDPRRNTMNIRCRFFNYGNCNPGKDCRFSHIVNECVGPERSENENLKLGQYLLLLLVKFHALRLLQQMHKHKVRNQLTYSKGS